MDRHELTQRPELMQTCLVSLLAHTAEASKHAIALTLAPELQQRASTFKC